MDYYRIADFPIAVDGLDGALKTALRNMAPFASEPSDPVFTLSIIDSIQLSGEHLPLPEPEPGMSVLEVYKAEDAYLISMSPGTGIPVKGILRMEEDFKRAELSFSENADEGSMCFAFNNAMMVLFAFRTATLGALEFHSSVVINDGKGYMFLGKSGTGKSTHSRQWLNYINGTELLNDDNPVVRLMEDGTVRVYGSPWSGKTPCYKQKDVPVGAIVRIRQAPENRITRLDHLNSYASLTSSVSGLRAIKSIADGLHLTLTGLVSNVPCFTLDCLPDRGAAEVCYSAVHGA